MKRFWSELQHRRVPRVAVLYVVAGWVAIQVADVVFPRLGLPDWTVTLVVALVGLGLPVAVVLAWAFDVSADGIRRTPPRKGSGPRPAAAWVGLGILIGLVGFGGYAYVTIPDRGGEDIELDENRIAVLPFEVRAGPELEYLREAFVDLLSAKLNHAGELTSVDPAALLAQLPDEASAITPALARDLAIRFRAGHFVLGSILRLGGELEIQARLYDPEGEVIASATVAAREENLAGAVDELARRLLTERLRGPASELARAAATATRSLPALKAFLQGEARLREGDSEGAVRSFEQAVAHDSTFTFAYFRLAVARSWMPRTTPDYAATADAIERSLPGARDLPEREAALLRLFAAYWTGSSVVAEQLAWRILSRQPENLEARYYLGEVLFHGAGAQGRDIQEAREPLERVLALQPDHGFALSHLLDLALARGDGVALDTLGERTLAAAPELGAQVHAYRALAADASRRDSALVSALDGVPAEIVAHIAWRAASMTASGEIALRFAALLERAAEDPAVQGTIAQIRASGAALEGDWERALAILDPHLTTGQGALFAALLLISGGERTPRPLLERVGRTLDAASSYGAARGDVAAGSILAHYARGRIALLLGDSLGLGDATEALERIEDDIPPGPGPATGDGDEASIRDPRDLASYHMTALRAHREALEGRPGRALALLEDTLGAFLAPHEGFLMGKLLESQGRADEARGWYLGVPGFDSNVYHDLPLAAEARRRLTEAHEPLR